MVWAEEAVGLIWDRVHVHVAGMACLIRIAAVTYDIEGSMVAIFPLGEKVRIE